MRSSQLLINLVLTTYTSHSAMWLSI